MASPQGVPRGFDRRSLNKRLLLGYAAIVALIFVGLYQFDQIMASIYAYAHGSFMRVPPSLAYSAVTPALRLLTSSMKAGGHDHSRRAIAARAERLQVGLDSLRRQVHLPVRDRVARRHG